MRIIILLSLFAIALGGVVKVVKVKVECSGNGCQSTRWGEKCCFPWNGGDISMNPIDGVTTCPQAVGNYRNRSLTSAWLGEACMAGGLWQGIGWGGWKTVCILGGGDIASLKSRGRGWSGISTIGTCKFEIEDSLCDVGFETENGCFVDGAGNDYRYMKANWYQWIKTTGITNVVEKVNGRGRDVDDCIWEVRSDGFRGSYEAEYDKDGAPGEGGYGLQHGVGRCLLRGSYVPWKKCSKSCLISKDGIPSCTWKSDKVKMSGCSNLLTGIVEVKGLCVEGKCNGKPTTSADGDSYVEICQLGWGLTLSIFSTQSGLWLGSKMCKGGMCGWILLGLVSMWFLGVAGLHRILKGLWRGKRTVDKIKNRKRKEWCDDCEYWEDETMMGWHGKKCEDRCPYCKGASEEPGKEREECTERQKAKNKAEKKAGNDEREQRKKESKFMRRGKRFIWVFWFIWMMLFSGIWLGECSIEEDLVRGRKVSTEWWESGLVEAGGKGGDIRWGSGDDTVVVMNLEGDEMSVRHFVGDKEAWLEVSKKITCWGYEDRGNWVDNSYIVNTAFDCTGDCAASVDGALNDGTDCHWDKRWEHDTNWGCNPGWCWSISQGCFGARASLLPGDKLKVMKKLRGGKSGRKVCWGGSDECLVVARGECVEGKGWSVCLDGDKDDEFFEVQDQGEWWRINGFCDQNCRQGDIGDYMESGGRVSCPGFDGSWAKECATGQDPKANLQWDGTSGVSRWRRLRDESERNEREKKLIEGYVCERGTEGKDRLTVKVGGTPTAIKSCDWKVTTGPGKGTWGSERGFDVSCGVELENCDGATAVVELCNERACFGGVQYRGRKGKNTVMVHGKGSDGVRALACCIGNNCGEKSFSPSDPDFIDVKHYNTTKGKSKGETSSCDWKCQVLHWWDGVWGFLRKFWIEFLLLIIISGVIWWVIGREKKRYEKKEE